MICPECKSEYRQGFFECSDCKIALVNSLDEVPAHEPDIGPGEEVIDYADYVDLMHVTDLSYIAFIRTVLDAEGFDFYILGEQANYHGMLPVEQIIRVKKDQIERAREILDEIEKDSSPEAL